jgi:hypothetical protein
VHVERVVRDLAVLAVVVHVVSEENIRDQPALGGPAAQDDGMDQVQSFVRVALLLLRLLPPAVKRIDLERGRRLPRSDVLGRDDLDPAPQPVAEPREVKVHRPVDRVVQVAGGRNPLQDIVAEDHGRVTESGPKADDSGRAHGRGRQWHKVSGSSE